MEVPGGLETLRDLAASVSQVLGLKVCVTASSYHVLLWDVVMPPIFSSLSS